MDGKAARDCATYLRATQGSARGPGRSARAAAHTPLPGAGAGRLAPGRCSLSLVSDPPGDRTGPAMNHAACPAERGGMREKIRATERERYCSIRHTRRERYRRDVQGERVQGCPRGARAREGQCAEDAGGRGRAARPSDLSAGRSTAAPGRSRGPEPCPRRAGRAPSSCRAPARCRGPASSPPPRRASRLPPDGRPRAAVPGAT